MATLWRLAGVAGFTGLALLAACGGDAGSLTTSVTTMAFTGSAPPGGSDPSGDDDDDDEPATSNVDPTTTSGDPTTGGAPTSGPDPTGDDTTGGPPPPSMETCQRYLDCLAVTSPEDLPEAQQGFGPDGTCWAGPPESQQQCVMACQTGLEKLHGYYPEEPACGLCQDADDCGPDMMCEAGECVEIPVPGCGDGTVQADETCDVPYCSDDDCQEATCNPLSHTGCTGGEECRFAFYEFQYFAECLPKLDSLPKDGQGCDYSDQGIEYCAPGLTCAPASLIDGCPTDGCCTRLCNTQEPDDCPNGRTCQEFPEFFYYGYVGVCVLL